MRYGDPEAGFIRWSDSQVSVPFPIPFASGIGRWVGLMILSEYLSESILLNSRSCLRVGVSHRQPPARTFLLHVVL
jgi:hypothetical protein